MKGLVVKTFQLIIAECNGIVGTWTVSLISIIVVRGRANKITMEAELEKIAYMYGDVCVRSRKQRRKRQKFLANELLVDYAKNSTLHGFRYIVEQGLSTVEKIFWFTTVIVSIAICSYYIYNVCQKWITSPVIVAVNEKLSSVETVPFPSVTICPQLKAMATVYNYTDEEKKYLEDRLHGRERMKFFHVSVMCDFQYLTDKALFDNVSFVNDITEVAPKMADIFSHCRWCHGGDRWSNCYTLFNTVYTKEGICYTSNTLAATEIFENTTQQEYPYLESNVASKGWSMSTGYDYSVSDNYPRHGRILGSYPDLELFLQFNPDHREPSCNIVYSGVKIYLQHPADIPQSSLYYYAALPNQLTSLAISFHEFKTDPSLSAYSPDKRQCYFPTERKLRYFKIYTMKNCQAECLTNYTLALCGCVGFYMPHNDSNQICATGLIHCMERAKDVMGLAEIDDEIRIKKGIKEACSCLPACDAVEYDAEILKTGYYTEDLSKVFNYSYSKVDLYFKKPQFMTMQRRELFGVTDLLANIGGLLGVFLGFSFLSLIEIIYFMTLRVGIALKRDLDKEEKK